MIQDYLLTAIDTEFVDKRHYYKQTCMLLAAVGPLFSYLDYKIYKVCLNRFLSAFYKYFEYQCSLCQNWRTPPVTQ